MAKVVVSPVEKHLIFNKKTAYTEILRVIDRVDDPYVAKVFPCTEYVYTNIHGC